MAWHDLPFRLCCVVISFEREVRNELMKSKIKVENSWSIMSSVSAMLIRKWLLAFVNFCGWTIFY